MTHRSMSHQCRSIPLSHSTLPDSRAPQSYCSTCVAPGSSVIGPRDPRTHSPWGSRYRRQCRRIRWGSTVHCSRARPGRSRRRHSSDHSCRSNAASCLSSRSTVLRSRSVARCLRGRRSSSAQSCRLHFDHSTSSLGVCSGCHTLFVQARTVAQPSRPLKAQSKSAPSTF